MRLKLKAILVSFISAASWLNACAQFTMTVNKDGIFANETKLDSPIIKQSLINILGNDYRVFNGINTIYTYDKTGVWLYEIPGSGRIADIAIDFSNEAYKFSPASTFTGFITINGQRVDRNFTRDSLINSRDLYFNMAGSSSTGYTAVTYNNESISYDWSLIICRRCLQSAASKHYKVRFVTAQAHDFNPTIN